MRQTTRKYILEILNITLKSGDFISYFSGQDELTKVIPRCVSMAYYDDGTPKRSEGCSTQILTAVWTREMDESEFGL